MSNDRDPKAIRLPKPNPLSGSPLLNPSPQEEIRAVPPLPDYPSQVPVQERQSTPGPRYPLYTAQQQGTTEELLYRSRQSPQFMDRRFEQRHRRETIYVNAYYLGAWRALVRLSGGPKNDRIQMMIKRELDENADLLRDREDLVRYYESQVREEFNI